MDQEKEVSNTGARPKRSSLKNWPPFQPVTSSSTDPLPEILAPLHRFPPKFRANTFHQQSLDDALEMRNLTMEEERELAQVSCLMQSL